MQGVGRVARSNFMHALCLRSYKLLFVFAVLGSFPVNIIDFCDEETLHRSSVVCWVKHPSPRWELYKERSEARGARHQPLQVAPTGQIWVSCMLSMARDGPGSRSCIPLYIFLKTHRPTTSQLADSLNYCRVKTLRRRRAISQLGEIGTQQEATT